jgi:hypothetical protein
MVSDDVQVRNVEFYVNGVRVRTDGTFPFEHFLVSPRRSERPAISIRARASDTGGNASWTDELVVTLAADARAPRITRLVPGDGSILGRTGTVAAFANEPLKASTVTFGSFRLEEAGPDRTFDTADDVLVSATVEVRNEVLGIFLTDPAGFPPGRYRATLTEAVTDEAGNALPKTTWRFVVYGSGAEADQDGDGIADELEVLLGLDPNNRDSDGNGIPDGDEDQDQDGVKNSVEVALRG